MTLRVAIVDDEPLARRGLRARLRHFDNVEVAGEYGSAAELLAGDNLANIDALFLDIQMPQVNGLELAEALREREWQGAIVFVTAFSQHAVNAFEAQACDYLLKPIEHSRLSESIERLRSLKNSASATTNCQKLLAVVRKICAKPELPLEQATELDETPRNVVIDVDGKKRVLPLSEIVYVEAAGDYMAIHLAEETIIIRVTLRGLLQQLGASFTQIHRSTAVNLYQVSEFIPNGNGDGEVMLKGGHTVRCSRTYRAPLIERLQQLI